MLRVQFEEDLEKLHNQFYAMGNEVLTRLTARFELLSLMTGIWHVRL